MTPLRPSRLCLLACFPIFLIFTACDPSSVAEDVVDNRFTLTIEPASGSGTTLAQSSESVRRKTIDGLSFFYDDTNPETGEEVFAIYFTGTSLSDGISTEQIKSGLFGVLARNSDRPASGNTYTVVQQEQELDRQNFIGALYEDFGNGNFQGAPYYLPTEGTVTITESGSNNVSGSVDIQAVKVTVDTTERPAVDSSRVRIMGEFTAKDVKEDQFPGVPLPSSAN